MKWKKYIGVLLGACMLSMFGGCYEPLDITDSEMDMIAEYAAGVLVEHGTNATDTLLNREEQEIAWAKLATPTPRPTLPPFEDDKKPEAGDSSTGDSSGKATPTAKPTPTVLPENTELTMQDLTRLIDKEGFFFRYNGCKETLLYQGANGLFAAAEEGKQLVVLEFDVMNQTDKEATLVLNKGADKEFVYTLRTGNRTIRPSLTLLDEDFYTSYNVSYKPGETKNCVLVFECDDDLVLDSMTLTVLRDVEGREDSVLIKVK